MDGQLEVVRALAGLRHVDRVPLAAALLKVFRSAHTHCCSLAELVDSGGKVRHLADLEDFGRHRREGLSG